MSSSSSSFKFYNLVSKLFYKIFINPPKAKTKKKIDREREREKEREWDNQNILVVSIN